MAASHPSRRPRYDSMRSSTSDVGWRPPSPSFSTTTTGSRFNMPPDYTVISRKDLRQSMSCLEELMAAAKAYRNALLAMSQATAAFAQAMEACSRVKGCGSANSALAGASGLQHLLANHEQLLADTVYRQFEIPLLSALDHYKLVTADRLAAYEAQLSAASARLRKTEAENLKAGKRRRRDLDAFRAALAELQRQVEEMDNIKGEYHREVLEGQDEIWETVLGKVAFVVRSQLDFYDKIAGKASDPILEPLVLSIPDPFDSYGPPKDDGHIFSVLAPLGMLDSVPQSPTPALTRTPTSPPPGRVSPSKSLAATITPARAETATFTISALGISSPETGRARRELSVIDERSAGGGGADGVVTGDTEAHGDEERIGGDDHGDGEGGESAYVSKTDTLFQSESDSVGRAESDDAESDRAGSDVGRDDKAVRNDGGGKDEALGVPLPHSRQTTSTDTSAE